ncbi:MAG: sigma-70 family RNA polymerase sigma factor [Proteobacteria bacterium]|nr:sigma-70 family RNA polymerase sigma factor [Pseudomonadota bacterium]
MDFYSVTMSEMGRAPLLTADEEYVVAQRIEKDVRELKELVLGSRTTLRQLASWAELVQMGEMSAKELLPRGNPPAAKIAGLKRRLIGMRRRLRRGSVSTADVRRIGLSDEKIRRLGNKIKDQGRRIEDGRPPGPLAASPQECVELARRVEALERRVEESKLAMLRANMRLVISIAKGFSSSNLEFPDLVQEGALGLMKALEKYKSDKGFKFSTYATWWVRQAIRRAIADKERTIRLPAHLFDRLGKIRRMEGRYMQERGTMPSFEEYAKDLHISPKRVEEVVLAAQEPVSLATPIGGDDEEYWIQDAIPDKAEADPARAIDASMRRGEVEKLLATLSDREERVLKLRFGIDVPYAHTLDEVGRMFHLTRERARQIQMHAIEKLKKSPHYAVLREYARG